MFEALITLCLTLEAGPCRDQLLPGFEAETLAECTAALSENPPGIDAGSLAVKRGPHCQPVGAALDVQEVAPGLFAYRGRIEEPDQINRGDVANLGFVVGDRSVAVVDTGAARWIGEALWRAIRMRTDKPVSHVILTHMHPDHVLGATPFQEAGALVVGHAKLPRALADRQANYRESLNRLIGARDFLGTDIAAVDLPVADEQQIDLGNRVLSLRAWPVAHTGTDLTVLDAQSGILFTGDLVFAEHTPALDGSLRGWQQVLQQMQKIPATAIIPGHGGPLLDWPEGAAPLLSYLSVLETETRAAIASGTRLGEAVSQIAAGEAENWQLFDAYNPRNATVAFTELEWE